MPSELGKFRVVFCIYKQYCIYLPTYICIVVGVAKGYFGIAGIYTIYIPLGFMCMTV